jgi:hypothetical protein
MKRLYLTIACLSAVASAPASAQSHLSDLSKAAKSHAVKAKRTEAAPRPDLTAKTASVDDVVRFSNPYAPPEGTTFVRKSAFPGAYPYPSPTEPHGGLSISMGKDGGGHTNGGLSWGF